MSKRPKFTIAQVVKQFEVSQSTLRRGITSERFPNATKDHAGRWVIPIDDVLNAGYKPRKTWLNEGSHDQGNGSQTPMDANKQEVVTDHGQLENELSHERAQVDKLKALLEAERAHVESLRMALRMIEPSTNTPPEAADHTPETSPKPTTSELRHAARKPHLFQRLFKHR